MLYIPAAMEKKMKGKSAMMAISLIEMDAIQLAKRSKDGIARAFILAKICVEMEKFTNKTKHFQIRLNMNSTERPVIKFKVAIIQLALQSLDGTALKI